MRNSCEVQRLNSSLDYLLDVKCLAQRLIAYKTKCITSDFCCTCWAASEDSALGPPVRPWRPLTQPSRSETCPTLACFSSSTSFCTDWFFFFFHRYNQNDLTYLINNFSLIRSLFYTTSSHCEEISLPFQARQRYWSKVSPLLLLVSSVHHWCTLHAGLSRWLVLCSVCASP